MDTQLTKTTTPATAVIVPPEATGDHKHRLAKFAGWMDAQPLAWYTPDLARYRDELLVTLAPSSVTAHLSTVRARYAALLSDPHRRDELYSLAGAHLAEIGQDDNPANRAAFVVELEKRIRNALAAPVKVKVVQDRPDADHLRLTREQAGELMKAPGLTTLRGLRDTAVVALMLCTGIREAELTALDVGDLRRHLGGELALHVREGKGCKERLVPYGALSWVLVIVDEWAKRSGIEGGAVFRGLYKGGKRLRPGRLSVRAVQYILADYPIVIDGELRYVQPHDLRRTYARRLYDAGVDVVAIRQNLGHVDVKTTLGYIGELDASKRRAPAVYSFDLAGMMRQGTMELQ